MNSTTCYPESHSIMSDTPRSRIPFFVATALIGVFVGGALSFFPSVHAEERVIENHADAGDRQQASSESETRLIKDEKGNLRWRCRLRVFPLELFNPRSHELLPSPDMSRIAYAAMLENGGNQMIVNGVKGKKYDFICEYQFSPNSKTLVHTAEEGDEAFVVINGREGPRYGAVLHVVISPDSKRVAYTTRGPNGLVVDGRWFGPYRFVEFESMVFSPDSKHFVYAADSADEKNACRLYLDGKEIDRCEELHLFSVRFTPDSGSLAYVYQKGGEWFVRFGATRYGPFEDADGVKMTISNDSKRSAFGVQHGKDWFLLCGDKKFGPYAWSPTPLFSPDSKHLAHVGGPRNKATVFLDGKPLGVYSGVGAWSFTPDSRHLAWIAEDGKKSTLVIDGAHAGDDVVEFQFSPDGKRLARIIRVKDIEYVEEAGQRGKAYKHVRSVSFSPDSRHLAYWASRGNDAVLVVDGLETFRFEGEILSSGFRANGTICGAGVMAPSGDENKFAQPANVKELKSVFEKRRLFLFEMAEAD